MNRLFTAPSKVGDGGIEEHGGGGATRYKRSLGAGKRQAQPAATNAQDAILFHLRFRKVSRLTLSHDDSLAICFHNRAQHC